MSGRGGARTAGARKAQRSKKGAKKGGDPGEIRGASGRLGARTVDGLCEVEGGEVLLEEAELLEQVVAVAARHVLHHHVAEVRAERAMGNAHAGGRVGMKAWRRVGVEAAAEGPPSSAGAAAERRRGAYTLALDAKEK